MAKYIIEIEDEPNIDTFDKSKYYKCKQVPYWYVSENIKNKLTPYTEPDRKAIEDEVWEFERCVHKMNGSDYFECFDIAHIFDEDHCTEYSYQQAKAKYEAWLKQKDEIHVGDEVEIGNSKGVAYVVGEEEVEGVYMNCDGLFSFCWNKKACRKTGRHFDEIEELLKKMRDTDD